MRDGVLRTIAFVMGSLTAAKALLLPSIPRCPRHQHARSTTTTRGLHLFKDLFGRAFDNDPSLSKDNIRDGMLDDAQSDDDDDPQRRSKQILTPTQLAWRRKMLGTNGGGVTNDDVVGTTATLDLYLTGIPNKDPSNDLFGSKTNISSRDRTVGQVLPAEPSVSSVRVKFLPDQKCSVVEDASGFCTLETKGDWRLSDGGEQIRFRFFVNGFTRTIETKGTIQKVYWSNEEGKSTRTQTVYSIEEGWLYGECNPKFGGVGKPVQWTDGVLKVELATGFLGVSSKMVPCGKFVAVSSERDAQGAQNAGNEMNVRR
jgi:hypothetical protein